MAVLIQIPDPVTAIIRRLESAGFEAYAVGGCVRDTLLGRTPKDWDITTSAAPDQVKALFRRTVDTGIAHGTVTVMDQEIGYEVTTYRIDGDYQDGRHPDHVTFTPNLREDLARRDFTINAMAAHPDRGLVDCFEGLSDLKAGVIRCVGNPMDRFGEDALRIMRAVRFSAQLGFEIDADTFAAARTRAPMLQKISSERVQMELVSLLTSPHPEYIRKAFEMGITEQVLPEYDAIVGVPQLLPNHDCDVEEHTLRTLKAIPADPVLRLTMLMHDFGKPATRTTDAGGRDHFYDHPQVGAGIAEKILKRLKFDNDTTRRVLRLIQWHGLRYDATPVHVRRAMNRVGADLFPEFLLVQRADVMGKKASLFEKKLALLDEKERIYHQILSDGDCYQVSMLAVNGRDLIAAGIPAGPLLGAVLERLCDHVIETPSDNDRDVLIPLALQYKDAPDIMEPKPYFF